MLLNHVPMNLLIIVRSRPAASMPILQLIANGGINGSPPAGFRYSKHHCHDRG